MLLDSAFYRDQKSRLISTTYRFNTDFLNDNKTLSIFSFRFSIFKRYLINAVFGYDRITMMIRRIVRRSIIRYTNEFIVTFLISHFRVK